jgi:hypothetical protein
MKDVQYSVQLHSIDDHDLSDYKFPDYGHFHAFVTGYFEGRNYVKAK